MLKLACLWISHRTNTTRRTPSKHLSPRTGLLTLHTHTHTVYPKIIAIGFDKSLVLHTLSFSPLFFSPLYLSLSLSSRLVVALSVTMGLFAIELAGFFSGVSMFNCTQGLLCILYMFSKLFHKTLYITKVHIMHSTAVVTSPSPGELQFAFVLAQY